MVSLSGAGFLIGSIVNNLFVEKLTIRQLLTFGSVIYVSGYLMLSTALNLEMAGSGFFLISFALAFIHTGFRTFVQLVFPTDKIGQLTTAFNSLNAVIEMLIVLLVSGLGSLFHLRLVLIAVELMMAVIAAMIMYRAKQLPLEKLEAAAADSAMR